MTSEISGNPPNIWWVWYDIVLSGFLRGKANSQFKERAGDVQHALIRFAAAAKAGDDTFGNTSGQTYCQPWLVRTSCSHATMLVVSGHGCRPSRIFAAHEKSRALVRQASKPTGMVTQRPLLLVHGNFSGAWSWEDFKARLLERGYTVYTVDLHWKRKQSGQLPGVADHALQITDCVRQHKLSDVVLVAHSYGGVPTMQAAAGRQRQLGARFLHCHAKVQVTTCTHKYASRWRVVTHSQLTDHFCWAEMPDEVSAAIFMNAHILQNNQSIAQQAPARVLSLIEQEADKSDGYWFREVVSYEAVQQNFFPVWTTGSSPLVVCDDIYSACLCCNSLHLEQTPADAY